jgi:GT2 family glycosyltransferase
MLRTTVLPDLTVMGEIFDEDFFSYHEDTDLAWRARQMGYDSLYVPMARAAHGRGWRREGRERVPPEIRRHSFKNRYLEMIKNERASDFVRNLPPILGMELARFAFALFRDREVLPGYMDAVRGVPRAFRKRRLIQQMQNEKRVRLGATPDGGKAERSNDGAVGSGRGAT